MDSIRGVGSELLQGQEKHNRMIDLMGIKKTVNESKKPINNEDYIIHAADGKSYGIFRENKNFFVKYSNKHTEDPNDFEYIGGLVRKTKELHESYSDAFKRLNVMISDINQKYNVKNAKSLFESDKQYVLQPENPVKTENPESSFTTDSNLPAPTTTDSNLPAPTTTDNGNTDENDPVKLIQSLTGQLGQAIRDNSQNEQVINPEMIKYVLNSMLSAVDLTKLTPEEKEAISNKVLGKEENQNPENNTNQPQPESNTNQPQPDFEQTKKQQTTESLINLAKTYEQELGINNLLSICENKNIRIRRYMVDNDKIVFESLKGKRFIINSDGSSYLMTENNEYKKLVI